MAQILFTVFGMGYIYENAQIIDNHGTLLHTTVVSGAIGIINTVSATYSDCK